MAIEVMVTENESADARALVERFGIVHVHEHISAQTHRRSYTVILMAGKQQGMTADTREQAIRYTAQWLERGYYDGYCGCGIPKLEGFTSKGTRFCKCGREVMAERHLSIEEMTQDLHNENWNTL